MFPIKKPAISATNSKPLLLQISARLTSCGKGQGCWLSPAGCEQSTGPTCMGVVSWVVTSKDITFTLITFTEDLVKRGGSAVYGAIGFSKDAFMVGFLEEELKLV